VPLKGFLNERGDEHRPAVGLAMESRVFPSPNSRRTVDVELVTDRAASASTPAS